MMTTVNSHIKDGALREKGKLRIEWAERDMPVLRLVKERYIKEKPLKGAVLAACLHVTTETANLMITLKEGGAKVLLCASNPLSTQDDVAASLVHDYEIPVFAIKGEDNNTYYQHINQILDAKPQITMDDGADLVSIVHKDRKDLVSNIIGGTEETTTGVIRLRSMANQKHLMYPIISVNDANTKHLFDNRYGTGQSTMDGIIRATNRLIAGSAVVVAGYGWCGRGVAMRAKGMGGHVIVTEVDSLKALEAVMDGFTVMPMQKAAAIGDIFVTVTGDINVIDKHHMEKMKDGAIISNSGHFNVEINTEALKKMSKSSRQIRDYVVEYTLNDGRKINLLGEGRLINLAAAEGHPSAVMDMSFCNQSLSAEYLWKAKEKLENNVYPVPKEIDEQVSELKLMSMGVAIDELTAEQKKYLASWEMGT